MELFWILSSLGEQLYWNFPKIMWFETMQIYDFTKLSIVWSLSFTTVCIWQIIEWCFVIHLLQSFVVVWRLLFYFGCSHTHFNFRIIHEKLIGLCRFVGIIHLYKEEFVAFVCFKCATMTLNVEIYKQNKQFVIEVIFLFLCI